MVDLSKKFNTNSFEILSQTQKDLDVPLVTRFSLWTDSNQDSAIMQGGEFYGFDLWNRSSYFVTKPNIPPYSIWRYDIGDERWSNITSAVSIKADFVRAVGGAGVSAPRLNMSFYIGGVVSPRCASTAPDRAMIPQGGMMVFDHSTNTLTNETYGLPGSRMAYWYGSVNYLSIGQQKGFLISLMGEMGLAGLPLQDLPDQNDEHGDPVSFAFVMLYNIETKRWINQTTRAWEGNYPVSRSRFCAKVVYSKETRTWELWVFGGMLIDPLGDPVQDVFVLTMPSFVWVKIQIAGSDYSRTHSCEVVGSQLLVVGGYPPGRIVEKTATCLKELIRVFDMNTISWASEYQPDTEYRTPQILRDEAEFSLNRTEPADSAGWADDTGALEAAFRYGPYPPIETTIDDPPRGRGSYLRLLSLLVILVIVIVAFVGFLWWQKVQDKALADVPVRPPTPQVRPPTRPRSPAEMEAPPPVGDYVGKR